jgi:ParB family chromosome partitioning protein
MVAKQTEKQKRSGMGQTIINVMKKVLGRGLSSLISTPVQVVPPAQSVVAQPQISGNAAVKFEAFPTPDAVTNGITYLPISKVIADPKQPRQTFGEGELLELAQSIKEKGVLQPLIVRKSKTTPDSFELIAGERRLRASKLAGLTQVPVIVNDLTDTEAFEIALIENIQRANLTPIEEARAYDRLATEFNLSQEEIAKRVGKSRASVANSMRLLKLPQELIDLISDSSLTMGHAKAILSVKDPQAQISFARMTVRDGLSVRALELVISQASVLDLGSTAPTRLLSNNSKTAKPNVSDELTEKIQRALATKVTLNRSSSGKGRITIHFYSDEELSRLVDKFLEE